MSTPIPPNTKLEGLDLYAPRGAQAASAPDSHTLTSPRCPDLVESEPPRAESEQPPAATTESLRVGDTPVSAADEATRPFRDLTASISASLPPAPKLTFDGEPVDGLLPPSNPPRLDDHVDKTTPRRHFPLDPEFVPPPPIGVRLDNVAPRLIISIAGCAAIIGLTMISAFQPGAHLPNRTSENNPAVTSMGKEAGSKPRLVVDIQKAFANEPLSLGISIDSATGHESLLLAGLAFGTRLSAGVPVNEANWQLTPGDLNGAYVYAPKNFIGVMNTAFSLLSANQTLIESRAVRLEWIAKSNLSPHTKQIEPETVNAPAVHPINPEDAALMERGRDLLRSGDVASAQLAFDRLANAGIADAALALAATYDPRYLAQHNLIGVAGDETKARYWYRRASEIGSTEASRILTRTNADY